MRETDNKHKKPVVSMKEGDRSTGKTSRVGGSRHAYGGKGLPSMNTVARLDFAEGSKALKEVGKQAKRISRHRGFKVPSGKHGLAQSRNPRRLCGWNRDSAGKSSRRWGQGGNGDAIELF